MTKKIISIVLIAAMVLSMMPATIFALDQIDSYLEFEGFPTDWITEHTDFSITAIDGVTAMSVNNTPVKEVGGVAGGGVTPGAKPYVKYKALGYDEEKGILEIGVFIGNITAGAGIFTVKYDKTNWGICDINTNHYGREFTAITSSHKFATCFMKPFDMEYDYYIDEEDPNNNKNTYGLTEAQAAELAPDFERVSLVTKENGYGIDFENGVAVATWYTSAMLDATNYEMPVLRFALIKKGSTAMNATTITEPLFSELPGDLSVSDVNSSTQFKINDTVYSTTNNNLDYVVETLDGTKYGCAQPVPGVFKYEGNTENALSYDVSITVNGTPYQKTYNVLYDDVAPSLTVTPEDTSDPAKKVEFTITASDSGSGLKGVTVNNNPHTGDKYIVTESGEYIFRAIDNAGNETKVIRNVVIDNTPPALNVTGNATDWTNKDVVLTINTEEDATVTVNGTAHTEKTYTVTDNGEFKFVATDKAGNSSSQTVEVTFIDKVAPTITVTPDITALTNGDVTLTVTAEAGATVTLNGEAFTGTTYVVTDNGEFKFVATDKAGNTAEQVVSVTNIDKVAPTLTVTPNKTTPATEVTLTVTAEDGATVTLNGEAFTGTTYVVTDNGEFKFVATDAVGNTTEKVITVSNIDRVAPDLDVTGNATEWTNEDVVLTISTEDGATVTVNGTAHTEKTYTVTKNGDYKFVATDAAGNKTEKVIEVRFIDKVAPSLTATPDITTLTNGDVTITVNAEDGATVTVNGQPFTGTTYVATANGEFKFVATDKAGNTAEQTVNVTNIDKELPTLSVSDGPIKVSKAHTFEYEANDVISGIEKVTVSVNGSAEDEITDGEYVATAEGEYVFTAYDKAGNKFAVTRTVAVGMIDTDAPEIAVSGAVSGWTNENIELTVAVTDKSSVTTVMIKDGQEAGTLSATGNVVITETGTYKFVATDAAGNTKESDEYEFKIDKINPTLELSAPLPTGWCSPYTVAFKYGDQGGSGIESLTLNGEDFMGSFEATENGEYVAVIKDKAGNTISMPLNITNVDTYLPEISNISALPTDWVSDYKLTFNVSDDETGIHSVTVNGDTVRVVNGLASYAVEGSGDYEIIVTDNSNNIATETVTIEYIDNEAPVVETPAVPEEPCQDYTFEITATDSQSGVESVTVNGVPATKNGDVWKYYIEANGTYSIKALDKVGRESDVVTVEVDKIDNQKPVITFDGFVDSWTNKAVNIPIQIDKAVASLTVEFEGNTENITGATSYNAEQNGIYTFTATDELGNVGTASINVTKIDRVIPEIMVLASNSDLVRELTATIEASDDNGDVTVTVSKDGGAEQAVGTSYTITANGEYTFVATDKAGNKVDQVVIIICIDREPPVLTVGEESEYAKEISLPVSVTDNKSSDVTITVEGEPFNGSAYTITENGTYVFKAVDEAGNETTVTRVVTKIDRKGPIVTLNEAPTEWTNSFTLSINAVDSGAGVAEIKVDGNVISGTTYEVPGNGTYKVVATDALGNESVEKSITVEKLDKANPEISVSDRPTELKREHTYTITTSDALSGVKEIAVNGAKIDGNTYTVTADGEYKFVVTDNAGNTAEQIVNVNFIDTEAPVLTVDEESEYAKVIDLPVSVTDNKSSDITITVNDELFNGSAYTITENGTYVFKAVDEVGNETTVTRVVTKIDRKGPIVTLNEAPTEWTNSFTLSINAVDSGAGVAAIKVNGVLLDGTTYEVPGNGTYKVVATDALGNESEEKSITVEKLDKANPEMVITDAPVAWTREHTFEITASDALSGIKEITVNGTKLEGLSYTVTAKGEYKFVVTDNAGNVFEKTVNVTKIDELAPVFGGELASKEILIDSIKVALPTATDDSGEAVTYELYLNGAKVEGFAGESEYTFTGLTVATSYTVKLIATDTVGRTTEITAVYTTVNLGRIEATVDLSGFTASADKLHMSMVVNGVTLPVDSDGKVVFEGLTEGTYTATFKAAGFFDIAKAELVVKNGEVTTINITKAELVAGDTTADGVINIYDLNAVASAFAESYDGETGLIYDFTRDGKVDANDIKILIANYNKAKAQ